MKGEQVKGEQVKVHIPASIEEAIKTLQGLGSLLTAKEWERAAIVWAYTKPGKGGQPKNPPASGRVPFAVFARHGIHGLSKKDTVSTYWHKWQDAIDDGWAKEVNPGDEIDLPEQPFFPPTPKQSIGNVVSDATAEADDSELKSVASAIVEHAPLVTVVEDALHPSHGGGGGGGSGVTSTWDGVAVHVAHEIVRLSIAHRDGEWTPTDMVDLVIRSAHELLGKIIDQEDAPVTIKAINDYLKEYKKQAKEASQ